MKKARHYKLLNQKNEEIISLQREMIEIILANASLVRQKDHLMGLLEDGLEAFESLDLSEENNAGCIENGMVESGHKS